MTCIEVSSQSFCNEHATELRFWPRLRHARPRIHPRTLKQPRMSTIPLSSAPARQNGLRAALVALASFEAWIALLQSLTVIFPDGQIATGHLAEQITIAHRIVAPILAVAALVFAARDRLPQAIMALAAIGLTTWASDLVSAQFTGSWQVLLHVFRPVIAVLAIILAIRRMWLGYAAVLVASMWLLWAWVTFLSEVIPFVIGVMIYGA